MRATDSLKPLPRVRCLLGPDDCRWVGIRAADRDLIKQLPRDERWWSRTLYCWITPPYVLDDVREWLEAAGYEVVIVDVSQLPAPRDWHEVYAVTFGRPCPHRKAKKPAERPAAADLDQLEAAA